MEVGQGFAAVHCRKLQMLSAQKRKPIPKPSTGPTRVPGGPVGAGGDPIGGEDEGVSVALPYGTMSAPTSNLKTIFFLQGSGNIPK